MSYDYATVKAMPLYDILTNEEEVSAFDAGKLIIDAGAFEIRDVDNGEAPFFYSSGFWGPGYAMIKGLVSSPHVLNLLVNQLALKLIDSGKEFDFVSANVTGGMVPGAYLRNHYELKTGKNVPLVYIRNTRDISGLGKVGGHFENITGTKTGKNVVQGMTGLIVEELVNFANSTGNAGIILRQAGYKVNDSVSILFYNNPNAMKLLKELNLNYTYVIALPELISVAEETNLYTQEGIDTYRAFLKDPAKWQEEKGLTRVGTNLRDKDRENAMKDVLAHWRKVNDFE